MQFITRLHTTTHLFAVLVMVAAIFAPRSSLGQGNPLLSGTIAFDEGKAYMVAPPMEKKDLGSVLTAPPPGGSGPVEFTTLSAKYQPVDSVDSNKCGYLYRNVPAFLIQHLTTAHKSAPCVAIDKSWAERLKSGALSGNDVVRLARLESLADTTTPTTDAHKKAVIKHINTLSELKRLVFLRTGAGSGKECWRLAKVNWAEDLGSILSIDVRLSEDTVVSLLPSSDDPAAIPDATPVQASAVEPSHASSEKQIRFDVDLGNLKTKSLLDSLEANRARLTKAIGLNVTLVIRGVGNASFYPKDGRYVMGATTQCQVRNDANGGTVREFTIPIETSGDFGQVLAAEIIKRLEQ